MKTLEGQVAIVTGAGRGIGAAIAKQLASLGARIAVVSRTEANSNKIADAICKEGGIAHAYAVDVANFLAVQKLGENILSDFQKVDILVNNAGVTRDTLLLRMTIEEWDEVLETNLKGAFNFIKAVTRPLIKQRSGRIINISSVIGLIGNSGQANYAASKAGLIGLTKSVAKELAGRGITVNAVAPGFIDTDMTAALSEDWRDRIVAQIPLGRIGKVEEIAAAVAFLASPQASYITGQVLTVDGGMVM
jgi:3-oxoacyl-[acyl-carrier protein] reductase